MNLYRRNHAVCALFCLASLACMFTILDCSLSWGLFLLLLSGIPLYEYTHIRLSGMFPLFYLKEQTSYVYFYMDLLGTYVFTSLGLISRSEVVGL